MRIAKGLVFAASVMLVWPLWLLSWVERRLGTGEQAFLFCAQSVALLPGLPGNFIRAAFYFGTLERCDWEVSVGFGSVFVKRAAIMEKQVSMGSYCVIGHAEIGAGVMMASRVSVPSGKRQHFDDQGRLSGSVGRFERVRIGAGCWVGEGAIIMADVGERCVVGAGAVVGKAVQPQALVSGNPARVVRSIEVEDGH